MFSEARNLLFLVGLFVAIVLVGTLGYILIEGMNLLEALYQTVTTITTVGFMEVRPLSEAGRLFTIGLIVFGVTAFFYGLGVVMDFIVGGQFTGMFRRRVMNRRIERMSGHYIVCGYGRVGENVVREFERHGASFIVVDKDPAVVEMLYRAEVAVVEGDASEDKVLLEAGIERAQGLVAALDTDAANTFVVLSAREMNPRLNIVARANVGDAVGKIKRAGADQVILPYDLSGRKMANLLLQPLVSDYLDVMTGGGEIEFRLEEFSLNDTCEVVGRSIGDLHIRRNTGATILAVRHARTGDFDTNPNSDAILEEGDILIAIGTPEDIGRLEELFACRIPARGKEGVYGSDS